MTNLKILTLMNNPELLDKARILFEIVFPELDIDEFYSHFVPEKGLAYDSSIVPIINSLLPRYFRIDRSNKCFIWCQITEIKSFRVIDYYKIKYEMTCINHNALKVNATQCFNIVKMPSDWIIMPSDELEFKDQFNNLISKLKYIL